MLLSQTSRFADLQIQGLPFEIERSVYGRLSAAADGLDAARPSATDRTWESYTLEEPLPLTPGGVQHLLLSTVVPVFRTNQDSLELSLCVAHDSPSSLEVATAVEVACWCPTDHNIHYAERHEWLVGTGDALAGAFEAAVATVQEWLAQGPHEPVSWRARAGLPDPSDASAGFPVDPSAGRRG